MTGQKYGPSLTLDAPPVQAVEPPKVVRLFGKELPQVSSSSNGCITWGTHFSAICVSVQFSSSNQQFPWSGQIQGDTRQQSYSFGDVLEVERWIEHRLVALRKDLLKTIPEQVNPEHRRDRNFQNLPPTPKLFGSDMQVSTTNPKLAWTKYFPFATAAVKYDHCLPESTSWSAKLRQANDEICSDGLATVEEVQTWLERELVNARNKVAAAIPPTYEEPATEVIPELLGMPLTWEKDSWVLTEVRELCDIRLMDAGDGNFIPRLTLPKFETVPLDGARKQLENVLGALYEIIDLSVVQQKPGEAAKLFSKKSAWLPLPEEEPTELKEFLVKLKDSGAVLFCAYHGETGWFLNHSRLQTWSHIFKNCSSYALIPE